MEPFTKALEVEPCLFSENNEAGVILQHKMIQICLVP